MTGSNKAPSVSLYCLHSPLQEEIHEQMTACQNGTETGLEESREMLENIQSAVQRSRAISDVMVAFMTIISVILATAVTYCCYATGVQSLASFYLS